MQSEVFPDGTPIDEWFYDTKVPLLEELGEQYELKDLVFENLQIAE